MVKTHFCHSNNRSAEKVQSKRIQNQLNIFYVGKNRVLMFI